MPDPTISYEFSTFVDPPPERPLGPGGQVGAYESFIGAGPTTFYAAKCELETHAAQTLHRAASNFGVSTCPVTPGGGTARGWR